MSDAMVPVISIILVMPDRFETIRQTVKHLAAQTICNQLELVIVAFHTAILDIDPALTAGFARLTVLQADSLVSIYALRILGVKAADAPVVAFAEDHCFPEPGWAAALFTAHQAQWVAVGPNMHNANPASMVSWADFLASFGRYAEQPESGEVDTLPNHNSSYKTQALLAFGARLEQLLESESDLRDELIRQNYKLYRASEAQVHHTNFSDPGSFRAANYHSGRLFAANRAVYARWSLVRRLAYVVLAGLLPVVRLWRMREDIHRVNTAYKIWPQVLPMLFVAVFMHSLGEAVGYLLGVGNALEYKSAFENHRDLYLNADDAHSLPTQLFGRPA
jgi:hypothetical protein